MFVLLVAGSACIAVGTAAFTIVPHSVTVLAGKSIIGTAYRVSVVNVSDEEMTVWCSPHGAAQKFDTGCSWEQPLPKVRASKTRQNTVTFRLLTRAVAEKRSQSYVLRLGAGLIRGRGVQAVKPLAARIAPSCRYPWVAAANSGQGSE